MERNLAGGIIQHKCEIKYSDLFNNKIFDFAQVKTWQMNGLFTLKWMIFIWGLLSPSTDKVFIGHEIRLL